ncbi:hypothetical protein Moror_8287 [Moniliophthora roreri MCA 2997]|uniref:Uncharacterized protein n=2 Tax=Moniliophthora roreri TaxID=221103 RepID=V2XKP9_MONRO|nr:hypothetical protein Moror_8287 [Moniliophthora roreri MCA 2997]
MPPSTSSSTPSNANMTSPGSGLQFAIPDNTTTCDSITFFWTPTGGLDESSISLVVTNQEVPEHPASTVITQTLSGSLSTNDQHFTWLHVNVPEGWYTVQAQMQNQIILSQSPAFFVQNGTDVSCIPGINTSSMDSSPKSSHHRPSHSRHLPLGEVVGIAVGSAAGFTILAMAFAFPQFWRHALTSPKRKHPYHQLF